MIAAGKRDSMGWGEMINPDLSAAAVTLSRADFDRALELVRSMDDKLESIVAQVAIARGVLRPGDKTH